MSLVIGAFTIGLILSMLSMGVWISFRVLRYTDITVDGSITLGASVVAVLLVRGWSPWAATLVATLAGAAAGFVTGTLHTRFKIQELLSGILIMTALYSINLRVMGRSNVPLLHMGSIADPAARSAASTVWSAAAPVASRSAPSRTPASSATAACSPRDFSRCWSSSPAPLAGQEFSWATAGKGGLLLWPLFGATNQLLGGLAFLVISFYLWRRGLPVVFCVIPMVFMLVMPLWAMTMQVFLGTSETSSWVAEGKWLLVGIGTASLLLELWMIVEAVLLMPKVKGLLEDKAPIPGHMRNQPKVSEVSGA